MYRSEWVMKEIPSLNIGVDKASLKVIISENYLIFAPDYMSFLGEWITGTYKSFNDADKYIILGYLFRKTIASIMIASSELVMIHFIKLTTSILKK